MDVTSETFRAWLIDNPQPFGAMTEEQRLYLREQLRPGSTGFTQQQREWLQDFYLLVPDPDALPNGNPLPQQTTIGQWVLNADLLTDCMRPGDTYHAIAPLLATLKLIRIAPEGFPVQEDIDA